MAVVGGGFMGTGIAESVAVAGLPVIVRDIDEPSLERARTRLERLAAHEPCSGGKLDGARGRRDPRRGSS